MKTKVILFFLLISTSLALLILPLNLRAGDFFEQALEYRAKGYQAQKRGNITGAIRYYQKAVILDPSYATPYNDLGVVYEMKGWLDRAEQAYLEALRINPDYLDVYSNLALLYERKNRIDEAVFYWKKRVQLGDAGDLWTQKAWQKLAKYAPEEIEKIEARRREEEAKRLAEIIARQKEEQRKKDIRLAEEYHNRASSLLRSRKYDEALGVIDKAAKLTPEDKKITDLKKRIEIKITEEKITAHYAQGVKYYRDGNYLDAAEEFKKILELLPGED